MKEKHYDIDIVLTWVDGNDKKWISQRNQYLVKEGQKINNSLDVRYRDWDNLQYIFRGIEKYMPWAHKVHFVTWGHLPKWLNVNHPKLHIVKHEDFIPKQYLPTFNSSVIELNVFRIPGLSEHFINFNDDMFVINKTKNTDFFQKGLPCDMACISPQPVGRSEIYNTEFNNLQMINDHFSTLDIKHNIKQWINPVLYGQYALRTAIFMNFKTIIGIFETHVPASYNKSIIQHIWELEGDELDKSCHHKFRSIEDHNEWLYRSWQLVSGNFIPRSKDFGLLVPASNFKKVKEVLNGHQYKTICINDDDSIVDFDQTKNRINKLLQKKFPEKSKYEL